VLEAWDRVLEVSPDDAWARMTAMLTYGDARPDRLTRAGPTEPGAVRARLKALLRASGHPELAGRVPAPDRRTAAIATRSLPAGHDPSIRIAAMAERRACHVRGHHLADAHFPATNGTFVGTSSRRLCRSSPSSPDIALT
jgi:hypothetical protein